MWLWDILCIIWFLSFLHTQWPWSRHHRHRHRRHHHHAPGIMMMSDPTNPKINKKMRGKKKVKRFSFLFANWYQHHQLDPLKGVLHHLILCPLALALLVCFYFPSFFFILFETFSCFSLILISTLLKKKKNSWKREANSYANSHPIQFPIVKVKD